MTKKKVEPFIGNDGRVYYNFPLGVAYEFQPEFQQPFMYRIISCEYENGAEYYRIESAGKEINGRFTVKHLNEILDRLRYVLVAKGKRVELPLLSEEVEAYYSAKQKEVNRENAAANKKLKPTDYYKNVSTIRTLTETFQMLLAEGERERAAEVEKKISELNAAQEKILSDNGVDYKVLTKTPSCDKCRDTGFADGEICVCAIEQIEIIKTFNAGLRLSAAKK